LICFRVENIRSTCPLATGMQKRNSIKERIFDH
jgi:hypothetical protein